MPSRAVGQTWLPDIGCTLEAVCVESLTDKAFCSGVMSWGPGAEAVQLNHQLTGCNASLVALLVCTTDVPDKFT